MLTRILTSLVGLVVFFAVIFAHHYVLYAAVALIIFGMLYEMYSVMNTGKALSAAGYLSALIFCAGFLLRRQIFALYAVCMIFVAAMIFLHGKKQAKDVLSAAFVTIFICTFMLALIMIRRKCDKFTVILPFIIAWLSDTGAYFVGSMLGKHKLAPLISPKKTVEGAIGGIILAAIGAGAYIYVMVLTQTGGMVAMRHVLKFAAMGVVGAIISQAGDLAASCIKRDCDKKDYGTLLPGHGGLLDRFDSVLFVIPFIYYTMIHFILK